MTMNQEIEQLSEKTFQDFLSENLGKVFVYETRDFDYQYYFPALLRIHSAARAEGRFVRQA